MGCFRGSRRNGRDMGVLITSEKGRESMSQKERRFTFLELSKATQNFREGNLLGRGGFGSVYKGRLQSGQVVAVKILNIDGHQGKMEFIMEVLLLGVLHHPNVVNLVGFCNDGDQRLLVYDYMKMGSLEDCLFDVEPDQKPLDWSTRLKIAEGAARGLKYLHCEGNPTVIHGDLKSSNILLDRDFNAKLSDFGLAKVGPVGDNTHCSTKVMGTCGYCAPDYLMSGKLSYNSDIYSFGVVLLELITGRRAIDETKKPGEHSLVVWSRPFLKDLSRSVQLADPLLQGRFQVHSLKYAVALTGMCLQEEAQFRPSIQDVVEALEYIASLAS